MCWVPGVCWALRRALGESPRDVLGSQEALEEERFVNHVAKY